MLFIVERFVRLGLSTGWPVENNPDFQVVGEVCEGMLGSGGDEHNVACPECIALAIVDQDALARHDHVDLVLFMRSLLVRNYREGELQLQTAAFENTDCVFTCRTWYTCSRVRQMEHSTAI